MPLKIVKTLDEDVRPSCDIDFMVLHNGRIFVADGSEVKIFNAEDLTPVSVLDAQQSGICCLAAVGHYLYAGTSGGNIIVFDILKGEVVKEMNKHEGSVLVLRISGDCLYSGDSEGKVFLWKNDELVHQYETCEEVWDMLATENLLYTVRATDLVVQKIVKSDKGHMLQAVKTVEGRGPLCRVADKICLLNREGRDIQILEDNGHDFPLVATLEGQDMMINSLACNAQGNRLYSGGYDCALTSYEISNDSKTFTQSSRLRIGSCVNCIRVDPTTGNIFIGSNNGLLSKIVES